jgi:hypothetical protein
MRARFLLVLALAPLACGPAPDAPSDRVGADSAGADTAAAAADDVISTRVAVFLLADSAAIAAARAAHGEEDFAVVADDMMWYRAEAWSWLEERGVPVVNYTGRPTLRFRVGGAVREFAFDAEPTIEVVVLYDADRAPLAVAPIDVSMSAPSYFGDLPADSAARAD